MKFYEHLYAMKLFFYFNGFNSAIPEKHSDSPKIAASKKFALARGYRFTPVSINYRETVRHSVEILDQAGISEGKLIFCGSSMGGWFARIMQLLLHRDRPEVESAALVFNPAFDPWEHRAHLIGPQVNYVTGEEYVWSEEDSLGLKTLEDAVDYDASLPFYVYADKGDEVIPWEASVARHAGIAKFQAFEGGCHSFDHYREALEDFDRKFQP